MDVLTDLGQALNNKVLSKELDINSNIGVMSKNLESGISKVLDKAATYIIKAMPIPDCAKDILVDVKNSLKTKDIKTILGVAIKSSIREGLELFGLDKNSINSIFKLKDIAIKGGLSLKLKNGIDIVSSSMLKNDLVGDNIFTFFKEMKEFVQSNNFVEKLTNVLQKLSQKKEAFLEQVKKWYTSYNNMDLESINNIAEKLKRKRDIISQYPECEKENRVIQNMTAILNNKSEKLSNIQLQLCNTL